MSLLATRCVFQRLYSVKRSNPSSVNIAALMTMQCHKNVQLKCLQIAKFSNFSRKAPISFTSKRYINITSLLRMSKNYYDVLGVPRNANQKQIKDAYYKLAMKHHPDKNQGNLTQRFREIKEAYDVLSSESSRSKYNNSSSKEYTSTSSNWSSNSSSGRYGNTSAWSNQKTSRTEYNRSTRGNPYDYSQFRPFNVFINVIKVPKNVIKTQIDIILLTFVKNRTLKLILFQLFQFIWNQMLKNVKFNILIPSTSPSSPFGDFVRNILTQHTVRIELTEMEAITGKAIRVTVSENEKVLIVNIPRGVKKNQSFYLFYLIDEDNNSNSFKA